MVGVSNLAGLFKRAAATPKNEDVGKNFEVNRVKNMSHEVNTENTIIMDGVSDDDTNELPAGNAGAYSEILQGFQHFIYCSRTSPGRVRKNNQDSTYAGNFNYNIMDGSINICIGMVADGMGGLAMGEVASLTAVTTISAQILNKLSFYIGCNAGIPTDDNVVSGILSDAMQSANNAIYEKGERLNQQIGTTFTGVVIMGKTAYFGHVGDSRAYIIDTRAKSLRKITRDHSLVGRLVEMGQITDREARSHPRRNEIYRMLGLKNDIEMDTLSLGLDEASMILLMSDGLWELVDDSEILEEMLKSSDLSECAGNLIKKANENGGYDNISIVVIKPVE